MSLWDTSKETVSYKYWFSAFDKFIRCMTDQLKTGTTANFKVIDPDNNYRTAYPYWNSE